MAFLFGHGETFIMAFRLSGGKFSGKKEKVMKREAQKSIAPVPWDNMPRQPELNFHPSHSPRKGSVLYGSVDPAFSSGQVFHPFPENSTAPEEEK